jgi:uncharacterized RDD family membrane protein YckC
MYCHRCGAQNDDQAAFCDKCGAALTNMRPMMSATAAPSPTSPESGPAPPLYPAEVEYAGFWKRLAAALIDGILLFVAYLAGAFVMGFIYGAITLDEGDEISDAAANAIAWVTWAGTLVLGWLYYALMESSSTQATLGKMALGIRVTDAQGRRVSFGRATGRYFSKIISGIILYIGYIMIAFTAKKQGLHDIIADCLVVVKGRGNPSL